MGANLNVTYHEMSDAAARLRDGQQQIESQLRTFEQAGVTDFVASLFHLPGESEDGTYELMAALATAAAARV